VVVTVRSVSRDVSSSEIPASGSGRYSGLTWILLLALALRAVAIFASPSIHHPDEVFQFLEPAHRLAFGYGIQTWEFSDGMRSLLLPYLFGRLLAGIALLGAGPQTYVLAARVLLAVLSLLTVAVVYRSALRQSHTHALLAGLVAASWFEIVYFSSRPLTEAIATNFLLMGVALASRTRNTAIGLGRHAINAALARSVCSRQRSGTSVGRRSGIGRCARRYRR